VEEFTSDIDALFGKSDDFEPEEGMTNILFIGLAKNFSQFSNIISDWPTFDAKFAETIDDAIVFLLQEVFALVILDSEGQDMDVVTTSRIVRINHPLARIVVFSSIKKATFIIDIVNQGTVDALMLFPMKKSRIFSLITEQEAKHEISKMMTGFISQPPKLSKASYLLLDPSLSSQFDENIEARFIGIMITHNSVPRYSSFFEDLLAKDEVLFASFLSGITMLGSELFATKEPLKEINFGGISVMFFFHEDLQISIFVRNLTSHNFSHTENIATTIVDELIVETAEGIATTKGYITKKDKAAILRITEKFIEANNGIDVEIEELTVEKDKQTILIYGTEDKKLLSIKRYLDRYNLYRVKTTGSEETAYKIIKNSICSLILLDSNIRKIDGVRDPFDFADHAKEITPSIQILYLVRDRRMTTHLVEALNCGLIDFMVPYRASLKELSPWIVQALEKSLEIKEKSFSGEEINQTIDQAAIAKTRIRSDEASYAPENKPLLLGIFITQREYPIFQKVWSQEGISIEFDQSMMAGLVAALDNVGEEMFYDDKPIGGLELGGAKILVQQRGEFNFVFFVKNIDPHTSIVVNKELISCADRLHESLDNVEGDVSSGSHDLLFEEICDLIYQDFSHKFG
jgi:DNA-binding response OmpR family regulator